MLSTVTLFLIVSRDFPASLSTPTSAATSAAVISSTERASSGFARRIAERW
jgi:hypothetical protein